MNKPKVKIRNAEIIIQIMSKIELLQSFIKEIDEASSYVANAKSNYSFKLDTGNLRSTLIDMELEQWRHLCMWGLTIEDETKERIKASVYSRSLRDGISVYDWIDGGVSPGKWLTASEDEFRAMAKELFKPKEEK